MNPLAQIQRVKSVTAKTYVDLRNKLDSVIEDAYRDENTDVWVRDFDDAKVWFTTWTEAAGSDIWEQAYLVADDGAVSLDGDRVKVRIVITYLPDEGTKTSPDEGDAEARHATAPEDTKTDDTPAGAAEKPSPWDHWASEAVLAGTDAPAEPVGSPDRLKSETSLEYMRQFLAQHSITTTETE